MTKEETERLGELLKAKRQQLGLSTHRLAKLADVDQATVVRIESGGISAPHSDKLARIAAALELPASQVFALAGYFFPSDLPELSSYLELQYPELLAEDRAKIEQLIGRLEKKRKVAI